ncbi:MAG TPA: hypothetical protein VGG41_15385 [Solirubrobacteraceae bacterium]|jgi:hypothetical protein
MTGDQDTVSAATDGAVVWMPERRKPLAAWDFTVEIDRNGARGTCRACVRT